MEEKTKTITIIQQGKNTVTPTKASPELGNDTALCRLMGSCCDGAREKAGLGGES